MLQSWIRAAKSRYEAHRRYRRAIAEISLLSQSDLIDIGAFQSDLYRAAHKEIYG